MRNVCVGLGGGFVRLWKGAGMGELRTEWVEEGGGGLRPGIWQ